MSNPPLDQFPLAEAADFVAKEIQDPGRRAFLKGIIATAAAATIPAGPPIPLLAQQEIAAAAAAPKRAGKSFLITTPVDDGHKLCFWESVRQFERAYYTGQLNTPHRFEFKTFPGDSLVPRARNNALIYFLRQTPFDVIFPLDSDLDFTPFDLLHMADLFVARDMDFLCGRYAIKEPGLRWCENGLPGEVPDAEGVLKLACAPGGIHMISRRCIETMIAAADSWPHWLIRYTDDAGLDERFNLYFNGVVKDLVEWPDRPLGRYLSEDWGISYLARKLGFPILCATRAVALHRGETFYPIGARRMTQEETEKGIRQPDGSISHLAQQTQAPVPV